jgi:hypothetical protein
VEPFRHTLMPDVDDDDMPASTAETAWLAGHVPGLESARARVVVEGEDLRWEVSADGGTFRLDRLEPGRYRVELRTERLVIARRIEVEPGANTVTLRVHPEIAWRIAGPPPPGAPVIRLPVASR